MQVFEGSLEGTYARLIETLLATKEEVGQTREINNCCLIRNITLCSNMQWGN